MTQIHIPLRWTSLVLGALLLAGCSTSKEKMFPHDGTTMMDVWRGSGAIASDQELLESRSALRRSIEDTGQIQNGYTRTAENEIKKQFRRLPNPDLVMYIYPHLSGSEGVPVPGYSTVFPLFQKVQYAMPGERTEAEGL